MKPSPSLAMRNAPPLAANIILKLQTVSSSIFWGFEMSASSNWRIRENLENPEHSQILSPSFWLMGGTSRYSISLMIHGDGCLGVEILKRSSQPKLKLRNAVSLEIFFFFAPAKTVVLLKPTVFAAQAAARDGGVSPAVCARGWPHGGCTTQHNTPPRAGSPCSSLFTKQTQGNAALQRRPAEDRELGRCFPC